VVCPNPCFTLGATIDKTLFYEVMKHQSQPRKGKLASRKHLSADPLFEGLHKDFLGVSDCRDDPDISMADSLMSEFAVFFLKDPSLLAFDKRRKTDGNLYA